MASIDTNYDYDKAQSLIESTKSYADLKKQYDEAVKRAGDSYEQKSSKVKSRINDITGHSKSFMYNKKSQFEHLLDINESTGNRRHW